MGTCSCPWVSRDHLLLTCPKLNASMSLLSPKSDSGILAAEGVAAPRQASWEVKSDLIRGIPPSERSGTAGAKGPASHRVLGA